MNIDTRRENKSKDQVDENGRYGEYCNYRGTVSPQMVVIEIFCHSIGHELLESLSMGHGRYMQDVMMGASVGPSIRILIVQQFCE
ncbi:MAG: hypothetical protein SGI77_17000 [Pirellulaceae bacterium]|nr:hypothetical protein [Pirellulaceae bacterium]